MITDADWWEDLDDGEYENTEQRTTEHILTLKLRDMEDIYDIVCIKHGCGHIEAVNVPSEGLVTA